MQIYKTNIFQRTFKKTKLTDDALSFCCKEMEHGLIDANYGGNLYKKRLAMSGKGKSGSYRTMIGTKLGQHYFFLYMFPKNEKDNINKAEEKVLKKLARYYLKQTPQDLSRMVSKGVLVKVDEKSE